MKKGDYILILVIIIIAITALIGKTMIANFNDNTRLIIKKEQEVLYNKVLDSTVNDIIRIEENGEYNIVKIENGIVTIIEANCLNQICVNDGDINKAGEIIVCLPHKVTVEIKAEKSSEVDIISE